MNDLTRIAFDHAPVGLVLTEHRIIRQANQTFCEMTGYKPNELINESFRRLYTSPAEFHAVRDIGLKPLRAGATYSDERLLRHSDGHALLVQFRARTMRPEDPLAQLMLSFTPLPDSPETKALTPRERTVVTGLSRGHTSKEIARDLGLSPRTIEDVRARLLRRFKTRNTTELLARLSGPTF